jgi:periplasmic divalent cation tolerance protein
MFIIRLARQVHIPRKIMTDKIVIYTTCGSAEEAERLAGHLVERRLAACVAVTAGVVSHYIWQGKQERSEEWALAIKSRRDLFPAVQKELEKLHKYEVPEILAVPVVEGSAAYLAWMDGELRTAAEADSLPRDGGL